MIEAPVVIQCYNSYGRVSFRFLTGETEWTITMPQKKAMDTSVVSKVEKQDDIKDYGARIVLTNPIIVSEGDSIGITREYKYIEFEFNTTVPKDHSREIWSELIDRGFKPTQKTQKLIARGY